MKMVIFVTCRCVPYVIELVCTVGSLLESVRNFSFTCFSYVLPIRLPLVQTMRGTVENNILW